MASDSRLTIANNSYADVGIKVLPLAYRIWEPSHGNTAFDRKVAFEGELGLCFAGSAVNSLMIKESVATLLLELQYAPGYTDVSLEGICKFIFTAYKAISHQICETSVGRNGSADFIICGKCQISNKLRAFRFSTDKSNKHSLTEALLDADHEFLGSGAAHINKNEKPPHHLYYFNVLREIILNESVPTVGGNIQYGVLYENGFKTYGIVELGDSVHHWRGSLDMNSRDFMPTHDALIPGITCIDPFNTFYQAGAA